MQTKKERFLEIFEEISAIPRGSGNEKGISDYIAAFAEGNGLKCYQDEANNVIIKKPGTRGYERLPAVIIQGHMDMVCEKNSDVCHDFLKDPLVLRYEGDFLHAEGTTLGADDGIAVAYALALAEAKDISHPPLEIVITSDEEAGMNGVRSLNFGCLNAEYLINIDSEEEGHLLSCCAGGLRAKISLPILWQKRPEGFEALSVKISGLRGGHSGSDIHLQRANSNKLMGRILYKLRKDFDIKIAELGGGNMDNAIPREAYFVAFAKSGDIENIKGSLRNMEAVLKREYRGIDEGITITAEVFETKEEKVFSDKTAQNAVSILMLIPHGVKSMSAEFENLVESSNNIGIVRIDENVLNFTCATRSSVGSRKYAICEEMETISSLCGADFDIHGEYPAWEYDPNSKLIPLVKRIYEQMFKREAKIDAIHAGLECGVFAENLKGVDMISIGPDMHDVHTPNERLSLSSAVRTWELIKEILKEMKQVNE